MAQLGDAIRKLRLKGSPLAELELDVSAVRITENISEPFAIAIDLAGSQEPDSINMRSLVGSDVTVSIGDHHWHGIVRSFGYRTSSLVGAASVHEYCAQVVPKLWRMTLNTRYRVFQQQNSGTIVQKIFSEYGLPAPLNCSALNKTLREYCTQFGETDLEFVARLIAEEGFTYRFEHDDSQSQPAILRAPASQKVTLDRYAIGNLSFHSGLHSAAASLSDYDDSKAAAATAEARSKGLFVLANSKREAFGSTFFTTGDQHQIDSGQHADAATYHIETLESSAHGTVCQFDLDGEAGMAQLHVTPGTQVDGIGPAQDLASALKLVVVGRQIRYSESFDGGSQFGMHIDCGQAIDHFCLPVPAKPQPRGPLTGIVTALNASESDAAADPTRLVKVKFPWADGSSESCWVRVAQAYAGNGWGASFVPRINQEVLVEFLNGDLDRPVVVGALYNATGNPGPGYTSTQSGIKSAAGKFNELRFDDKQDAEELYLEAGKDLNYVVHNNQSGKVEKDYTLTVQGEQSVTVQKTRKDSTQQAHTVESNEAIELKVGGCKIKIDTQGITLEAMGNKIKLDSGGISIEGTMLKLNSQSTAQLKANASVSVEGSAMAEVKSSGMTTIKGSMTMIN